MRNLIQRLWVRFNLTTFIIAAIIYMALSFASLVAAGAMDEGTGGNGIITKAFEKSFYLFRFPSHTYFFEYMNGPLFFAGLIANCLLYAFITERIFSFYKTR